MFNFRRYGLLGMGGYYVWKNRSHLGGLLGRFKGRSQMGNEKVGSDISSEQDKSNLNIGQKDDRSSGAV